MSLWIKFLSFLPENFIANLYMFWISTIIKFSTTIRTLIKTRTIISLSELKCIRRLEWFLSYFRFIFYFFILRNSWFYFRSFLSLSTSWLLKLRFFMLNWNTSLWSTSRIFQGFEGTIPLFCWFIINFFFLVSFLII